ncbi:MAG: hypothetical protein ACE5HE_12340 [Phycisphaerae bacterium]
MNMSFAAIPAIWGAAGAVMLADADLHDKTSIPIGWLLGAVAVSAALAWKGGRNQQSLESRLDRMEKKVDEMCRLRCKDNAD